MLCNKYMGLMMSKTAWAIVPGSTSAAFANDWWQHCAVTEPVVRKSSTNSLANYLRQRLRCYTRTCENPAGVPKLCHRMAAQNCVAGTASRSKSILRSSRCRVVERTLVMMPASIFCRVYPVQRDWKLRNENTFQRGHEDVQALLMCLEPLRDARRHCPHNHCKTRASALIQKHL